MNLPSALLRQPLPATIAPPRPIVLRTRGRQHGPIVRLVSPSDIGERIKPFIFLDRVDVDIDAAPQFGFHPHSGIATLTLLLDGGFSYQDSTGASGTMATGAVEWMQAGGGVWHTGNGIGEHIKGYQLWLALPPGLESSPALSRYLDADAFATHGPARVILGALGDARSPIDAPSPITYLDVRLAAGETWRYDPPAGHDVLWMAVHEGRAHVPETIDTGELAVFAEGDGAITVRADGDTAFVLGSARKHPHDLVLGSYSVHTSPEALALGEANIRRIASDMQRAGTMQLRRATRSASVISNHAPPSTPRPAPCRSAKAAHPTGTAHMSKTTLAVIGGGAAGHQIAHDLREQMDVTLIDPKTYWEVPMALPRLLVEPDALPARMSFASFLPGVRLVQGHAVSMTDGSVEVHTANGRETVTFDYAVIATGSRYVDPLIKAEVATEAERQSQIADAHARIRTARHVIVAGGGPVGVETAAELRETFPQLQVTLVHGADKLLDTGPDKFGEWAAAALQRAKVALRLKDKVVEPALGDQPVDGRVRTHSGKVFDADMVIWAAGTQPNTAFVATSWPDLVQDDGLVKTDGYLRLERHPNIFVAGDITNLPEGRLVITASFHVPSIVANLKAMQAAGSATAATLEPYSPKIPGKGMGKLMVVTLGRRDGLTSLPFGQFRAAFIARNMKSKNMFVDKYRKAVGLS